jgi:hypothetical protein
VPRPVLMLGALQRPIKTPPCRLLVLQQPADYQSRPARRDRDRSPPGAEGSRRDSMDAGFNGRQRQVGLACPGLQGLGLELGCRR